MNGNSLLLFDPPFLRVGFAAHASSAACKLVPFVSVSLHPAIITIHTTKKCRQQIRAERRRDNATNMNCKYSRKGRHSFREAPSAMRTNAEPKRSTKISERSKCRVKLLASPSFRGELSHLSLEILSATFL